MEHIAIIGATGSTGKELVRLALKGNYKVTVIARKPEEVEYQNNQSVVKGDVTDLESLIKALNTVDSVISCFGPSQHRKVGTLMSTGTLNIIKAIEKNNIKRFIFMSGFVQADYSELSLLARLITPIFRIIYHQSFHDKNIAEAAIQKSHTDWTIVRAPGLNHSLPTGKYKAGIKKRIYFGFMSYTDCAQCLLDSVNKKSWTKQVINVGRE